MPNTWWLEMPNRACVMDFASGDQTVSVAAEFIESLEHSDGTTALQFRTFPVGGMETVSAPLEVRLLSIVGGSSCVYVLLVITYAVDMIVVSAEPVAITQRQLRRFPRTPYHLGPCTAVVHSAVRQWRGLVEFWVHDVSTHGVGFVVIEGHADRVIVGDYLRAPITLPDGTRSWIDGEVIWLTSDGRGGLLTRRAPQWVTEQSNPTSFALS